MIPSSLTGRILLGPHADALYGDAPLEAALVHHGALERLAAITDIAVLRDARAAAVVGDLATARRHLDVHRERFGEKPQGETFHRAITYGARVKTPPMSRPAH